MTCIYKLKYIYRDIKYGVKNLIKWFPVVWRDRDWYHAYLFFILEHKLSSMSKLHEKYGNTVKSPEKAKTLKEMSELAGKIGNEDYTDEAFGDRKYLLGKMEVKFEGNKIVTVGVTEEERNEISSLSKLEPQLIQRDIDRLFDTMKRDVTKWWD